MASYSLNLIDDGNGNFTATAFKAPTTAASGGTAMLGAGDSLLSASYKLAGKHIQDFMTIVLNDRSTNG
jgi:hypothetical protein